MVLTISLTPSEGARLNAMALHDGVGAAELARKLVTDHLPPASPDTNVNQAAIDLLQSWLGDEAPTDPDQALMAERELQEFKRNMNANRVATGERLVFRE